MVVYKNTTFKNENVSYTIEIPKIYHLDPVNAIILDSVNLRINNHQLLNDISLSIPENSFIDIKGKMQFADKPSAGLLNVL